MSIGIISYIVVVEVLRVMDEGLLWRTIQFPLLICLQKVCLHWTSSNLKGLTPPDTFGHSCPAMTLSFQQCHIHLFSMLIVLANIDAIELFSPRFRKLVPVRMLSGEWCRFCSLYPLYRCSCWFSATWFHFSCTPSFSGPGAPLVVHRRFSNLMFHLFLVHCHFLNLHRSFPVLRFRLFPLISRTFSFCGPLYLDASC